MVKFCESCGSKINEGENFCQNCGALVDDSSDKNVVKSDGVSENIENTVNFSENNTNNSTKNTVNGNAVQNNRMAMAAFGCGVIGLIFLTIIMGILAIVFSAIGLNQIKNRGEKGKGLAIAALVIGIIEVAWCGLSVIITLSALSI